MTVLKIDNYKLFKNAFSESGRKINKQIRQLQTEHPQSEIYYREYKNGRLALSAESTQDDIHKTSFVLLENGNIVGSRQTDTEYISNNGFKYKIFKIEKKVYDFLYRLTQRTNKTSLFRMPQNVLEEAATKVTYKDNSILLTVHSAKDRQTKIPATDLAQRYKPSLARKVLKPNGDTVFIERHDRG
ncbi:MAG: hypothetical protein ACI37Q_03235 [Candidatus Gastranaerophilaceae bacterium]